MATHRAAYGRFARDERGPGRFGEPGGPRGERFDRGRAPSTWRRLRFALTDERGGYRSEGQQNLAGEGAYLAGDVPTEVNAQAHGAHAEEPTALGERLNKRLADMRLASRREADEWIERGWVLVNGQPAVVGQRVA